MTYVNEGVIAEMVAAIVTTRDFCGNECEAATDVLVDYGVPPADRGRALRVAFERANAEWDEYRRAAGVTRRRT